MLSIDHSLEHVHIGHFFPSVRRNLSLTTADKTDSGINSLLTHVTFAVKYCEQFLFFFLSFHVNKNKITMNYS